MTLACDCHVRLWSPAPGPELTHYQETAGALGLGRMVFVAPDSRRAGDVSLSRLLRHHARTARGVAQVGPLTPEATLEQLHLEGVRGLRLVVPSGADPLATGEDVLDLAARAARRGCHVELSAPLGVLARMAPVLRALTGVVVIDRIAEARPELGLDQPGLDEVLDLLAAGRVWVKLAGLVDRAALPILRALIATDIDHLVWGSNWPDDGAASLALLAEACGDAESLARILERNPAVLYGFALA